MESEENAVRSCPLCQLAFPTGYPDDALIKHIDSHLENSKIWTTFFFHRRSMRGSLWLFFYFYLFRFYQAIWACLLALMELPSHLVQGLHGLFSNAHGLTSPTKLHIKDSVSNGVAAPVSSFVHSCGPVQSWREKMWWKHLTQVLSEAPNVSFPWVKWFRRNTEWDDEMM